MPQTSCLGASFAFPQDHVYDAAEKGQGEGHPGQDVGKAIGVLRVEMPFRVPHRVDGGRAHYAQTWGKIEASAVRERSGGKGSPVQHPHCGSHTGGVPAHTTPCS